MAAQPRAPADSDTIVPPLSLVGVGGDPAGGARPVGVLPHARVVEALEGVRAEVVALRLQQVGRQPRAAVAIEEGERRREGGRGYAEQSRLRDDLAPRRLALLDRLDEVRSEQQVGQLRVNLVCLLDLAEEGRADDTASAPHEGDLAFGVRAGVRIGVRVRVGPKP